MTLRNLFTVNVVIALFFGLGLVLAPTLMMSLYGVTIDQAGIFLGRAVGAALLGYAVVFWSARDPEDSKARRGIVLGQFTHCAVGFIVSLLAKLTGVMNTVGWSLVAIYVLLALAYAYFLLVRPSTS